MTIALGPCRLLDTDLDYLRTARHLGAAPVVPPYINLPYPFEVVDFGSAKPKDKEKGYCYFAYLDGRRLDHCVEADARAGVAVCVKHDSQGRPMIIDNTIMMETFYGDVVVVRIKWTDIKKPW